MFVNFEKIAFRISEKIINFNFQVSVMIILNFCIHESVLLGTMYTFFQKFSIFKKFRPRRFSGSQITNLTSILTYEASGVCTKIYHENVNFLKIDYVFFWKLRSFFLTQLSFNWLNIALRDLGMLEFTRFIATEEFATEFARGTTVLVEGNTQLNMFNNMIYNHVSKNKNVQKVDIFVGYLGTDASYIKLDVKFVFCDPENPWGRSFSKIENF